jgi:tRNA(His) 5'-end guanylyltransferase
VTIVLGYLIADGFEFEQAVNYVRARRTEADPNQGFLSQLAYWQLTLKGTVPNDASLADVVEMIEQDIRAAEIAAHNSRDKWKNLFTSQNLSRVPPELANSMIQGKS